jgi:hypothetical protein
MASVSPLSTSCSGRFSTASYSSINGTDASAPFFSANSNANEAPFRLFGMQRLENWYPKQHGGFSYHIQYYYAYKSQDVLLLALLFGQ